jgi:shikimate kinase
VISLGGGGFINEKIRKEVLKNNFSFWLNCSPQTLLNRIKKNKKRPIAFNLSDSELTELIAKRTKIYAKAQFKINCHKLTKIEIVEKILKIYDHN